MTRVQDGIYQMLVATTEVSSRLSTYRGKPAIFTRNRIPGDAVPRYCVIEDALGDSPWDTKTTRGREVLHDIKFLDFESGDPSLVQDAAEFARDVLHRGPGITVSGYGTLIAVVSGPIAVPSDDQTYGRVITARFNLIQA